VRKKLIILLLVIAVLVAVAFLPPAAPPISTLPKKDVSQIVQAVRREMRHDILSGLSLNNIRQFPSLLSSYWTEQILSINVQPDGTVLVTTGHRTKDEWGSYGSTYELKLGPNGWLITSRAVWISRLELPRNPRLPLDRLATMRAALPVG
jgi:hypothetical protein